MNRAETILNICQAVMATNLKVRTKTTDLVFKRAIYFRVCKDLYPLMTFDKMAKAVARDHATAIHGLKLVDEVLSKPIYLEFYRRCKKKAEGMMQRKEFTFESLSERIRFLELENKRLRDKINEVAELCQNER